MHYCKFHSNEQSRPLLVSKVYFEKYMSSEYQTDIDENDNFRIKVESKREMGELTMDNRLSK